jgi:large subunit ribosomal protein L29
MEARELREMGGEELGRKLAELREEVFRLRLKRTTGQSENPMKLRETRRELARVMTVLREKGLAGGEGK